MAQVPRVFEREGYRGFYAGGVYRMEKRESEADHLTDLFSKLLPGFGEDAVQKYKRVLKEQGYDTPHFIKQLHHAKLVELGVDADHLVPLLQAIDVVSKPVYVSFAPEQQDLVKHLLGSGFTEPFLVRQLHPDFAGSLSIIQRFNALRDHDYIVIVCSAEYEASLVCQTEFAMARNLERKIVPLLISEKFMQGNGWLRDALRQGAGSSWLLRSVDLWSKDYASSLSAIAANICQAVEKPPPESPSPPEASATSALQAPVYTVLCRPTIVGTAGISEGQLVDVNKYVTVMRISDHNVLIASALCGRLQRHENEAVDAALL